MGCTQSTERKSNQAPVEVAPAPATVAPVTADPVQVVVPAVQQPAVESPKKEEAPISEEPTAVQSATPLKDIAAAPQDFTSPQFVEELDEVVIESVQAEAPVEEAFVAPCIEPTAEVEATPAVEIAPAVEPIAAPAVQQLEIVVPVVAAPVVVPAAAITSPIKTIPTLALGNASVNRRMAAKVSVTPRKAGKSPRTKENPTPAKSATKAQPAEKKVGFETAANPTMASATAKKKDRMRKAAGTHYCNIQEEMFLASVAAFERQLTHRGTLEKHLNTR